MNTMLQKFDYGDMIWFEAEMWEIKGLYRGPTRNNIACYNLENRTRKERYWRTLGEVTIIDKGAKLLDKKVVELLYGEI